MIYFGLTGDEGSQFRNSVTTAELMMILNDPELLKKTMFFRINVPPNASGEDAFQYMMRINQLAR